MKIATAKLTIFHQSHPPHPLLVVASPLFKALQTASVGQPARRFAIPLPPDMADVNWKGKSVEQKGE